MQDESNSRPPDAPHAPHSSGELHGHVTALLASSPMMLWTSAPNADCTFSRRVWLDVTGRGATRDLDSEVHPEDAHRCSNDFMAAVKARRSFTLDYRLKHADGDYRWMRDLGVPSVSSSGSLVGYAGACFEMSDP